MDDEKRIPSENKRRYSNRAPVLFSILKGLKISMKTLQRAPIRKIQKIFVLFFLGLGNGVSKY